MAAMKRTQNELNSEPRQTSWHFGQWWMLPLFLAMVWVGCKPAAKVAVDINPAGTYALVSVNGNKVPCALQHDGQALTIKSGAFIIKADGTCSSAMAFSLPNGNDASREVKATYTREGSKLSMKWEGAGMTVGTVEGDTFTMNNEGMVLGYRK